MSQLNSQDTPLQDDINTAIDRERSNILTIINSEISVHQKIHEIRKSLKKLRALVRLVRHSSANYESENIFYRDLGRIISEYRDKSAVLESLNRLTTYYEGLIYKRAFSDFKRALETERANYFQKNYEVDNPLHQVDRLIQQHQKEFTGFTVDTFKDILPGIEKVYSGGSKALQAIQKSPSTENFHDWRKRTKYLRNQLEMLLAAHPHSTTPWEEALDELSDLLGEDHDYAVLLNKASELKNIGFKSNEAYDLFLALVEYQRHTKQNAAISLGHKIYLDPPKVFTEKLTHLLEK